MDFLENCIENAPIEDVVKGVMIDEKKGELSCIICGKKFHNGVIYPHEKLLLEAHKAVELHVAKEHGGVFHELLAGGKEVTGVSDIQKELLECMYSGASDKDIAAQLGGKSESTIRNQRSTLKRKKREAKRLLALMEILEQRASHSESFLSFHADLPTQDDRAVVSDNEAQKIYSTYFDAKDPYKVLRFPKKQKIKLVILKRVSQLFKRGSAYSEKEVNEILKLVYHDYIEMRRYLIDYAFLERTADGSQYSVNKSV
ncbi:MAG: DUF2087 domain-containing protein [Fibrobacterales bacterium]